MHHIFVAIIVVIVAILVVIVASTAFVLALLLLLLHCVYSRIRNQPPPTPSVHDMAQPLFSWLLLHLQSPPPLLSDHPSIYPTRIYNNSAHRFVKH